MKGGDCDKVHFELSRWESTAIPKLLADLFLALLCRQIHRLLRRNLGGFGAREWARVDPPSCKWPDQQISGMETLRGPWHSLSILEYLHHLGVPWQDVGFVWIAPYDTTAFETPQVWLKGLNPIHKIIQVSGNIPVTKKQVVPRTHEDTFCIMIIHDTRSTIWDKVYKVNKKHQKVFRQFSGRTPNPDSLSSCSSLLVPRVRPRLRSAHCIMFCRKSQPAEVAVMPEKAKSKGCRETFQRNSKDVRC